MKATRAQLDRALKAPASVRLFLLHGPDEAASSALARRIPAAMGAEVERVELSGAEIRGDPARLSDEAASISMFGTGRCVLVSPAGDEVVDAVSALLDAPAAGSPVVLTAGMLKSASKLLKLALGHPAALAFASYAPDARDMERLVAEMAGQRGLMVRPDVAARITAAAAGDRGVVEQELEKFALYLDAAPGRGVPLEMATVAAVGATLEDGDMTALVNAMFDGDPSRVEGELARLRGEGTEGITLIRAAQRRAVALARAKGGGSAGWQGGGRNEQAVIDRQASAWAAERLARALGRLLESETQVKAGGGLGALAADIAIIGLARQASRRL